MPEVVRGCSTESEKDRLSGGRRLSAGGTAFAVHAGSRKNGQGPERKSHLAYQLPGPGNMAKFPHHLLPVHKTALEKSSAKREPLQCLAVQLCFANNPRVHLSEGITMPLVHNGF